MKKSLVFLLFILFISTLNAQSFHGGLNLGFNISQVDGDKSGGYHKIAPTGGVYVRNGFKNPNWGMSLAILYRNKGSRANIQNNYDESSKFSINLHYIEVPLMFNYRIEKIKIPNFFEYDFKRDFYMEFGASLGYLIKGTEKIDRLEQPKNFKKYEVSLHIGLTYRLSEHWFLNYRFSYTFPFTPIHLHSGGQVYWLNRGLYNNNMNFSIIYEF